MNLKEKHQLWIEQYEAVQRSGLSIAKWAIQNNLSVACISKRNGLQITYASDVG